MGSSRTIPAHSTTPKWTNFHRQLALVFIVTFIWISFVFTQYLWYYNNATFMAVNRLIRHEALLFEQKRLQQKRNNLRGEDGPTPAMGSPSQRASTMNNIQQQSRLNMNDFFIRRRVKL
jgi:hypothetical protein